MSNFALTILIDKDILKSNSDDKLVISRKVNGKLNAVFDGYSIAANLEWKKLLSKTEFKWKEEFKVFLVDSVNTGDSVRIVYLLFLMPIYHCLEILLYLIKRTYLLTSL